jgi:hypothetical protein
MIFFVFPIIFLIIILIIILFFYSIIKKKSSVEINIPEILPENGYTIPLVASFLSFKKAPLYIALAHNNAFPLFILFHDHIEYRVLLKKSKYYHEIEYIDIRESVLTENIVIAFKDSHFTFSGNLMNKKNLMKVLSFFEKKGICLKDSARQALTDFEK